MNSSRIPRKAIAARVQELLRTNAIRSAPVSVEKVAKSLGLSITLAPDQDDLSGFLLREDKTGHAVIGVNRAHAKNRQRFTIAHEIGHFLLHEGETVHVDGLDNYRIERRSKRSSAGDNPKEIEANAFAAELLMPKAFVASDVEAGDETVDLSDDKAVEDLATRYQVSVAAMTFRLANLGYLRL